MSKKSAICLWLEVEDGILLPKSKESISIKGDKNPIYMLQENDYFAKSCLISKRNSYEMTDSACFFVFWLGEKSPILILKEEK